MNSSHVPNVIIGCVLIAAAFGGWKWYEVEQSRPAGGVSSVRLPLLENFELTERSGETFRSDDMAGKVWVVTFFFSTCDGTCSRLNANIRRLTTLEEIKDVVWVSISVDPVNDTLEVLQNYADNLRADPQRWLFCRGELSYVKRLADNVLHVGGVQYQGHNDYAVVLDKQGDVRGMFNAVSKSESEKMVVLLQELLDEPATAGDASTDDATSTEDDGAATEEQGATSV